jgi:alpha,alpha-trehalase
MAYKGLKNYGHTALALQIRSNWMKQNEHVYQSTGKMMEKYNVTDTASNAGGGEYPNQDGFGWTNGVYLKMAHEQISGPHDDL